MDVSCPHGLSQGHSIVVWQEVLDLQGVVPVHNEHLPVQAPPDVLLFALFQEHSPCSFFALFQELIWSLLVLFQGLLALFAFFQRLALSLTLFQGL